MDDAAELLAAFEGHQIDGIRRWLAAGHDPNAPLRGKPPLDLLIEMYTRSDRFVGCLRAMIDAGAHGTYDDLLPVLLDDVGQLESVAATDPEYLRRRIDLPCAFVSLAGATLLHLAAEYGHVATARWLLDQGVPVDEPAVTDPWGLNGHTALFHTVNSNGHRSAPVMNLLLERGARPDRWLRGLWWGRGLVWETVLFDVSPISFAQFGRLPQFHRTERDTWDAVSRLLTAAGRPVPPFNNVPNRYLA